VENLGPQVNTAGDEMFPTFAPDGVLYFSSDGHSGMGGLDLFSARLDDWDTWHITHLGAPMNSAADDFGMTFMRATKEQQEGYFASNRNQGKGYDNIYYFRLPSIKITITGTVYDMDEEPIGEAIVRVVGRNGMNFKSVTKPDGTYQCSIDRSTEYVMMSGKKGYLNRKAQFTSDPEEEDADYEVDFYLPSVSEPVLVDNVFYDFNKATLQEASVPSLDDLVSLLNDNPYVAIELSAHTDRVGSQTFNLDLAQRRAQTVCDYLVSKGIDPDRLQPVGYGKEQPKVVDDHLHERYDFLPEGQVLDEAFVATLDAEQQEVADQINRRTEFKVLTTTWGIE
jgi:peptidoglycan-associated lipoprotein